MKLSTKKDILNTHSHHYNFTLSKGRYNHGITFFNPESISPTNSRNNGNLSERENIDLHGKTKIIQQTLQLKKQDK